MSRRRRADRPELANVDGCLVPTPVTMRDVVRELERLADLATGQGDAVIAAAAERVLALAERLRAQFVLDLTGPLAPSEAPVRLDAARERRTATAPPPAAPAAGSATRVPAAR